MEHLPAFSPPQAQAVSMERVRSFVRHVSRHGYGVGFHREGLLLVLCKLAEPGGGAHHAGGYVCTSSARFSHDSNICARMSQMVWDACARILLVNACTGVAHGAGTRATQVEPTPTESL
jgi:hypothetical protein